MAKQSRFQLPKDARFHVWYWLFAFFGLMLIQYVYVTTQQVANIPYSQFEQYLKEGKVAEIGISDRFIQGRFKEPIEGKGAFVTTRVDPDFAQQLEKYSVRYNGQVESTFLRDLLSWILPVALFFGVWSYLGRRFAQGAGRPMAAGQANAQVHLEPDTGGTLLDAARAPRAET